MQVSIYPYTPIISSVSLLSSMTPVLPLVFCRFACTVLYLRSTGEDEYGLHEIKSCTVKDE